MKSLADVDPVDQLGQGGEALQVGTHFCRFGRRQLGRLQQGPVAGTGQPVQIDRIEDVGQRGALADQPGEAVAGQQIVPGRGRLSFADVQHGPRQQRLGRVVILQQRRQENDREDALFLGKQGIVPLGTPRGFNHHRQRFLTGRQPRGQLGELLLRPGPRHGRVQHGRRIAAGLAGDFAVFAWLLILPAREIFAEIGQIVSFFRQRRDAEQGEVLLAIVRADSIGPHGLPEQRRRIVLRRDALAEALIEHRR